MSHVNQTGVDLGGAAQALAEQGAEVFPLLPGGKIPIITGGMKSATTDLQQIRRWWDRSPQANIGFRPPPGMLIVDIDPRNGGTLAQLDGFPPTHTVRTGGGGWHLYYWLPEDCEHPPRGRVDGTTGIDIKSRSGYVVAPPSLHSSGNRYEITQDRDIAEIPDRLLPLVVRVPRGTTTTSTRPVYAASSLVRTVLQAPEGQRNDLFFWAACRAYERGATPEQVEQLRAAALHVGLTASEIESTARSAEGRTA